MFAAAGVLSVVSSPRELRAAGVVTVGDSHELERLKAVLLGSRDAPVIVITQCSDGCEPAIAPQCVREILGGNPRIYFVSGDHLLTRLRAALGSKLALPRGAVRIFWPGLTVQADPYAHPIVTLIDDEPVEMALAELVLQFDLSRPNVRPVIKLIEDARTVLHEQVTRLEGELRQARSEAQAQRRRALAAEQRIQGVSGAP